MPIILSGKMLSQEELFDKVREYSEGIFNKHKHPMEWHVLQVIKDIPNEQRWPEQFDLKFIRVCLMKCGVGKISELMTYQGKKASPSTPFQELSETKSEEITCPQCEIYGGQGCPRHRHHH